MGPAKSPMGLVVLKHQGNMGRTKLLSKVIIIIYQFHFFFLGYMNIVQSADQLFASTRAPLISLHEDDALSISQ